MCLTRSFGRHLCMGHVRWGKALFIDVLLNSVLGNRFVSRRVRWRALRALGTDLGGCGIARTSGSADVA